MLDYYHILGITSPASPKDVVAAYRAKCKILHPDVNPSEDATLQMQMVNEAYSVLSNHDLRRQYDIQYGYSATNTNGNYSEECSTPDFDYEANREGIKEVVKQQFEFAKIICQNGLVPIIEPEVDINAPENGILLPDGSIDSIYHGSKHLKGKSHSTNYTQYVYDHIKSVKSKRELLEILDYIKKELWNEELSLYDQ